MKAEINEPKINDEYIKEGDILGSRYVIEHKITSGGLSDIYLGYDLYQKYFKENDNVIIKLPKKELLEKKDIDAFVYSEFKNLKNIKHPNIVNVFDFGVDENSKYPYLILENLNGNILYDLPIHSMSTKFKFKLFKILYETISHIHEKGIIHADINPKNIMVSKNNLITLFDFGISQMTKESKISFSFDNAQAFNPIYSAPEVLQGQKPTIESDIFSFACTLYEIFALELPFNENSLEFIESPFLKKNCSKKIPYIMRSWFVQSLNINPENRIKNFTFLQTTFLKKI